MKLFSPKTPGPILVTRGDGVVAHRVALKLIESDHKSTIRVGVMDPSAASEALKKSGAEIVKFDWDQEETYKEALAGISSVFLAMPHHTTWQHNYDTFIDMAKSAGVKHIVKLSFYHALAVEGGSMANFATRTNAEDPFLKVPLIQMHRECDMKLIRLPITYNYSILFASHFMSNATVYQADRIRDQHSFIGASNGKKVNYISPNDVANAAVQCLLAPKEHRRVGYTLTGPNPMTDEELAKKLSKKLEVNIEYKDMPVEDFANEPQDTDWGPALDVAYLEYVKASGVEEESNFVSRDLHKVCGTDGETFDQYLQEQGVMTPQELSCFSSAMAAKNLTAVAT